MTLPLSYSRLRLASPRRASPPSRRRPPPPLRLPSHTLSGPAVLPCCPASSVLRLAPCSPDFESSPGAELRQRPDGCPAWLANRSSAGERRLVAREGFEPSKALGRQIYSLCVRPLRNLAEPLIGLGTRWNIENAGAATRPRTHQGSPATQLTGAGEGIRTPDRLITNQLLYRTELRQPDKGGECSPLPRICHKAARRTAGPRPSTATPLPATRESIVDRHAGTSPRERAPLGGSPTQVARLNAGRPGP